MNQPFETLIIEDLKEIKKDQKGLIVAFQDHKEFVNQKFVELAIKTAEEAGAAKTKAKLWSIGGAAFATMFAGSWEALKHFLWK